MRPNELNWRGARWVWGGRSRGGVAPAPGTFALRVGDQKLSQAIATGPRALEPHASADAEFAIVGLPDGTRNDLSADNTFAILVSSARRRATGESRAATASSN